MLRLTFVGWQGWLAQTASSALLIDPLLTTDAGRGPPNTRQTIFFWPPRRWAFERFPAVDAIFLSHEHEDHFNIGSLARIDRRIPVYLSARSSSAARSALAEMGFSVRLLYPGQAARVGELELQVFSPDHLRETGSDEWDTLGYLVRDLAGAGAFFTSVDVGITPAMRRAVEALGPPEPGAKTPQCLGFIHHNLSLWSGRIPGPEKTGERMSVSELPIAEDARSTLEAGVPMRPFPGQSFVLKGGRLAQVDRSRPFLRAAPKRTWGKPPDVFAAPDAELSPTTGRRSIRQGEQKTLREGLARFAEHLYGGPLFKHLLSLDGRELDGRKPTFCWLLLDGDGRGEGFALEYSAESCAFVPLEDGGDDLQSRYTGVLCCFAPDLVSVIKGEIEPRAITRAFRESWAPPLERTQFFSSIFCTYFHPLRHPDNCLRQYRADYAAVKSGPVWIKSRR
jgi:hypothetical protein